MDGKYLAEFSLKLLFSFLFYTIFALPISFTTSVFFIYRTLVYTILKFQIGSNFWGLLSGKEAIFSIQRSLNNVVNILLIVKTNNTFDDFVKHYKQNLETQILENSQLLSKFLCTRHKAFGYHYLKKNQIDIEKYFSIRRIKTESDSITKDELLSHFDHKLKDPLPYDNTGMWDISIYENPIKWFERDNDEKSYAVVFRIHHSVGDGVALLKCLTKVSSATDLAEIEAKLGKHSESYIASMLSSIIVLLMIPISVLQRWRHKQDSNSLHQPIAPSNENHFVAKVEEAGECVKIIKSIKKNRKNTSFTDVLLTAVSRSFSEYLQMKGRDPGLTYLSISVTRPNLRSSNIKSAKMQNNFYFPSRKIPIIFKETNYNFQKLFMETLDLVKSESKKRRKTFYNVKAVDAFLSFACFVFPEWAFLPILGRPWITVMMTNMPGFPSVTIQNGCLIEDMLFWLPVTGITGLSLAIFSYDSRLQIAVAVNKAHVPEREDAQRLVDGIYQAIIEVDSHV